MRNTRLFGFLPAAIASSGSANMSRTLHGGRAMSRIDSAVRRLEVGREMHSKWLSIALSTQPLDVDAAEQAVYRAYDVVGQPLPDEVRFYDSPLLVQFHTS